MKFFRELKVVKTKKIHECAVCSDPVQKGERALVESGRNRDEGFFSDYFHISENPKKNCYWDYFEGVQPNDTEFCLQKIKDPNFTGQLRFDRFNDLEELE